MKRILMATVACLVATSAFANSKSSWDGSYKKLPDGGFEQIAGDWYVRGLIDEFRDYPNMYAIHGNPGVRGVVGARCYSGVLNATFLYPNPAPGRAFEEGTEYDAEIRVDKGNLYTGTVMAVSTNLVQIEVGAESLLREIAAGKTISWRIAINDVWATEKLTLGQPAPAINRVIEFCKSVGDKRPERQEKKKGQDA